METWARKTRGIIRRGTRASQLLATNVLQGTLYFVSDENIIERSTGTAWESFSGGSGTTGSVIFVGSNGRYTQDNANLFWDDTNNRLGIGTTAPGELLHVRKDQSATTFIKVENQTADGAAILTASTPAGVGQFGFYGSTHAAYGAINPSEGFIYANKSLTIMTDNLGSHLKFAINGNTEKMRLDTSGLGIGTTSPQATLDINGSFRTITITKAISYQMVYTDSTIYATTGAGGITMTLPAASANTIGLYFFIYKVDSGIGLLTIAASGTNTINGLASKTIANQWNGVLLRGQTATSWIATSFTGL